MRGSSSLRPLLKLGAHLVLSVCGLSAKCEFNRMVGAGLVADELVCEVPDRSELNRGAQKMKASGIKTPHQFLYQAQVSNTRVFSVLVVLVWCLQLARLAC